jgi:hypothetical protein
MGYLPRVLFFDAFQLGVESKNQVFHVKKHQDQQLPLKHGLSQ